MDKTTGKYEMFDRVVQTLNQSRRSRSSTGATVFPEPAPVEERGGAAERARRVRHLVDDSAEVASPGGGDASSSEGEDDGSADEGAGGARPPPEMVFFPLDPHGFDNIPLAGLAPAFKFQDLPANTLAEFMSNGLDPAITAHPTNHVGLVVADVPQGVSGEHWDAKPWSWKRTKKLLEWVGAVIKSYEPNSQNYNLIVICSWL